MIDPIVTLHRPRERRNIVSSLLRVIPVKDSERRIDMAWPIDTHQRFGPGTCRNP